MNNVNVTLNSEKNGIEVRFSDKPSASVLAVLKENGFRWSARQKMWYAKHTQAALDIANAMTDGDFSSEPSNKTKTNRYSLWEATRKDSICTNVDKSLSAKDIAANIRRHIRPRFPMCRISVTSDHNSVDINIMASPFAKDSDELNAIKDYITAYAGSYKYCTYHDPYGDYGSSYNIYGGYCSLHWDYQQTELKVSDQSVIEDFQVAKRAFEAAEREREEQELQARMEQSRIEHEEAERQRMAAEANAQKVESGVRVVNDMSYFVENLIDPAVSKLNSSDEYAREISENPERVRTHTCKVSREVYLDPELFKIFDHMLLWDWSFIDHTGGSSTDDLRVNSMEDYYMMSDAERETVEWYASNCVAIYCGGTLKYVVDAQGFGYCRYVYLYTADSRVVEAHETIQAISPEEAAADRLAAEKLADISADIIEQNGLSGTWNESGFDAYKSAMKAYIYANGVRFDVGVVRAIDGDLSNLKVAMYKLLAEVNGIQEQFKRAGLVFGQRLTLVKISDFGGLSVHRMTFSAFECTSYAQYTDAVKLIFTPQGKHRLYQMYLHSDFMLYDGWLKDVPENLLWDIQQRDSGIVVKHSKFMSFDKEQYNAVFEYYKNLGCTPLIDTRHRGIYTK